MHILVSGSVYVFCLMGGSMGYHCFCRIRIQLSQGLEEVISLQVVVGRVGIVMEVEVVRASMAHLMVCCCCSKI